MILEEEKFASPKELHVESKFAFRYFSGRREKTNPLSISPEYTYTETSP
jgi:hypothetical protein